MHRDRFRKHVRIAEPPRNADPGALADDDRQRDTTPGRFAIIGAFIDPSGSPAAFDGRWMPVDGIQIGESR